MHPRPYRCAFGLLAAALCGVGVAWAQSTTDLTNQIQQRQQQLSTLHQQIDSYQRSILAKQAEAASLKSELALFDDKIAQNKLAIKGKELELGTVALQIQAVTADLATKDRELTQGKVRVAEVLRQIYREDQRSFTEMLVLNASVGEFFAQLSYLDGLQGDLQRGVARVQTMRTDLLHKQADLASYRLQLVKTKEDLEAAKQALAAQQTEKQSILQQTKLSESRFQALVFQLQQEQEQANQDILNLQQQVSQRLREQGAAALNRLQDANFIWPVAPARGISTYFYDPTYPFRRYFEHPGIDIPESQGTPIMAAADGYVARAKEAGLGYSYIMLIHKSGLATVYGHVSRLDVAEDTYVAKGQVIGATGGLPGTRGAGRLTTGPHLHFEIRSNGIPVNPLDYLP